MMLTNVIYLICNVKNNFWVYSLMNDIFLGMCVYSVTQAVKISNQHKSWKHEALHSLALQITVCDRPCMPHTESWWQVLG